MSEHTVVSDVGSTVLFENDRVRVWEMVLDPGEHCAFHQHHHDHVVLYGQAGTMRGQEHGDEDWGIIQNALPGFVLYRTVGHEAPLNPHRLKNLSDETVVHYIIELLEKSPEATSRPWVHNDRGTFHVPDGS